MWSTSAPSVHLFEQVSSWFYFCLWKAILVDLSFFIDYVFLTSDHSLCCPLPSLHLVCIFLKNIVPKVEHSILIEAIPVSDWVQPLFPYSYRWFCFYAVVRCLLQFHCVVDFGPLCLSYFKTIFCRSTGLSFFECRALCVLLLLLPAHWTFNLSLLNCIPFFQTNSSSCWDDFEFQY